MNDLSFFVAGLPRPKGSLRGFAFRKGARLGVRMTEGNADTVKPWMSSIAWAAREAGARVPSAGPLGVSVTFVLPRPKSHSGAQGVKASAPPYPAGKPDVDKLVRAVLDALTGIVWLDDSQVVWLKAEKAYGPEPGASVLVFDRVAAKPAPVSRGGA